MSKKIIGFLVCLVLVLNFIPVTKSVILSNNNDLLDGGWVEECNGIKIVHLKGSFYEMGYQQGYLLKYDILQNLRGFFSCIDSYDDLLEQWNIQKNYTSENVLKFIRGIADGADVSPEVMGCMWIWDEYLYGKMGNPWEDCLYSHCSTLAAWGQATQSNELIHVHSFDMPSDIKDPITGINILEKPVLIVADPDEGYGFMYPSFAGFIAAGGVNERGISISMAGSFNSDVTKYGTPYNIRIFEALYSASNSNKAIEIVTTNETFGLIYFICDGDIPVGYVVETTSNLTYVGTWDDSTESNRPFWQIDHVIRRTNCFINYKTTETQRKFYHPGDIRYLIRGHKGLFYAWNHYKAISKGCERHWGKLDLQLLMEVFRNVYRGRYGIIWFFIRIQSAMPWPWFQWVCCPKTGDMLISYSDGERSSEYNPVHHFNLFKLLNSNSP